MPDAQSPVEVFCSYAHADERWRKKLDTHLSMLKRQGLISTWSDRQIVAGTDWRQDLDTHLNRASMILLLISPDFLASDFCYSVEMKRALERHQAGKARVVPILVRPVDWKGSPFVHLQALPTEAKPVSTWSNKDTAFADVAAGIRRAIEDLSQLAVNLPQSNFPAIWNVPLPRNPFFTGREELLTRLHTQLQAGQISALSQPQAISGLGGIGKTQLAIEYAYRFRQEYQAVFWAHGESSETLTSSYIVLASLLNLPEKDEHEQEVSVQAVKQWLQIHKGWLLILDNADEPDLLPPFLPPFMGGHLLLTTRARALRHLGIINPLEVKTFSLEQGAQLLLHRAGILALDTSLEQADPSDQERAKQISQEFGGLPLALDQAGAYLEATGTSLEAYQQLYEHHTAEMLEQRRSHPQNHPEPVATTWSLSIQRVEEKNPAASELLRCCAFLAAHAIPEELISKGASELGPLLVPMAKDAYQLDQAIETLRAYSLIERDPVSSTLSVHRLVQEVVRAVLPAEIQREWMQRVILATDATFPFVSIESWPACERLLLHVFTIAAWIRKEHIETLEAAHLLNQAGYYLSERGRYTEAESLFRQNLAINERVLGAKHPDTAGSLNNLAALYRSLGKYAEAEPLFQRSLTIREQVLGSGHPDTAHTLNNLAYLYYMQGKYTEAEPLYQRSLAIREQVLGLNHPDTARGLNNLAACYQAMGKHIEAEPLAQQALAIREQVLGSDHPDIAQSLNTLAAIYMSEEKYAEAELLLQRALEICERVLGVTHPDTAGSLNNLASLYRTQGMYEEAEPLYQRALIICEQKLGQAHPYTAKTLHNLADLYYRQGKYVAAEPLFQRALTIHEQVLGKVHLDVAINLNNLAKLYESLSRYTEAGILYQQALAICEREMGPEHPDTRTVRANYFSLLQSMGLGEYRSGEA